MLFRSQNRLLRIHNFVAISLAITGLSSTAALAGPSQVVAGEYILKTVQISSTLNVNPAQSSGADSANLGRIILESSGIQTRVHSLNYGVSVGADAQSGSNAQSRGYVRFDPSKVKSDCAAIMQHNPAVIRCEPNFVLRAAVTPNDPGLASLWAINKISAPAGWDSATGSKSIVVAIIDSGIDYTHPDLAANMWINSGEIAGNAIDDDGNGYIDDVYGINTFDDTGDPADDNGHGTHCAGIVGAVGNNGVGISGVNWDVSLMAGKFLGGDGSGTNSGAIEAIVYAVDHGADVINASWGGEDYSLELYDAIIYAKQHGVVFVTAAGNDSNNNDQTPFYPASFELSNIISVAATDSRDRLASFSNYGASSVNIGAPGSGILSTVPGGYAELSGTSMATPHVAGLAALIKSAYPTMSVANIKSRILNGDSIASLVDTTITGKRINVEKALNAPVSGSNGASIVSLIGSRGTNTLYAGEAFSASLNGDVGDITKLAVKFASISGESLGKCSLGSMTIGGDGALAVTGVLKLGGSLAKFAAKATLTADHSAIKRRIRLKNRGDQTNRSIATSALRAQQDLKRTCRNIKASLVQS